MTVSCWKVTDKDDFIHVRSGAWEVSFPDGTGKLNTVTFSGPDARALARDYADTQEALELLK